MSLRVYHLDCCTMCPAAGALINDRAKMVSHCLLIETARDGLVLVDTGIGLDDIARPHQRLGRPFVAMTGLKPAAHRSAIRQVEALGHRPEDVRHIIVTHLDLDHAGGLPDFPNARVHVHTDEHHAAVLALRLADRGRYKPCHWAHGPKFRTYNELAGEPWFGFDRARPLEGITDEIVAIPLSGHSRGHAAIAVKTDARWLLHAGDAYFHHGVVDDTYERPRIGARAFERAVAWDIKRVRRNHERLHTLANEHRDDVRVFCAHDPYELSLFS